MADSISWVATIATIIAASMTAANLGSRITGYGFAVFLVGSLALARNRHDDRAAGAGLDQRRPDPAQHLRRVALARPPGAGRGGRAARPAKRARKRPARPCSRSRCCPRATVRGEGAELGHCVDAMAGCRSGRLELCRRLRRRHRRASARRLRRLPWRAAHVDGESRGDATSRPSNSARWRRLTRDQWPAR